MTVHTTQKTPNSSAEQFSLDCSQSNSSKELIVDEPVREPDIESSDADGEKSSENCVENLDTATNCSSSTQTLPNDEIIEEVCHLLYVHVHIQSKTIKCNYYCAIAC